MSKCCRGGRDKKCLATRVEDAKSRGKGLFKKILNQENLKKADCWSIKKSVGILAPP